MDNPDVGKIVQLVETRQEGTSSTMSNTGRPSWRTSNTESLAFTLLCNRRDESWLT